MHARRGWLRWAAALLLGALPACGGAPARTIPVAEVPPVPANSPARGRAASPPATAGGDPARRGSPGSDSEEAQQDFRRGWLGVELESLAAGDAGVRVLRVIPDSPAQVAGLSAGDVIRSVDGEGVGAPSDVVALVSQRGAGGRIGLRVERNGNERLLAARLEAFPDKDELVRKTFVDQPAPAFERLEPAQGSIATTLGAQRGKVVVVEFWAPWCVACRALIPHMNQWNAQYSARGLRVVGIANEQVARAASSARQLGMEFSILADPSGQTVQNYGANSIPAVFVIDRRGTVRDVMIGYDSHKLAQLDTLVRKLIAEP